MAKWYNRVQLIIGDVGQIVLFLPLEFVVNLTYIRIMSFWDALNLVALFINVYNSGAEKFILCCPAIQNICSSQFNRKGRQKCNCE